MEPLWTVFWRATADQGASFVSREQRKNVMDDGKLQRRSLLRSRDRQLVDESPLNGRDNLPRSSRSRGLPCLLRPLVRPRRDRNVMRSVRCQLRISMLAVETVDTNAPSNGKATWVDRIRLANSPYDAAPSKPW